MTGAHGFGVLNEPISSVGNALVKRAAALRLRKYRKLYGAFLVEGADLVVAGIRCGHRPQTVFVLEGSAAAAGLEEPGPAGVPDAGPLSPTAGGSSASSGLSVSVVTRRVAERLTTLETPPDVSAVFPLPEPPPLAAVASPQALVVYADHLADPGNLGTLLRAAAAFGATALITSPDTVDYLGPKVVRASMGAVFALAVYVDLTLSAALKELGEMHRYGLAAHGGAELRSADLRRPAVLCVGAERAGLSRQTAALADELLTIAAGGVESLNAGVAGAIALYEFACRAGAVRGGAFDPEPRAVAGTGTAPAPSSRSHSAQTKR